MRGSTFAILRTRARAALVVILFLMSALVTVALAGTVTYLDVAATSAVREVLATAPGSDRTAAVQTRVADDAGAQRTAASTVVHETLPAGAAMVHVQRTAPLDLADGGGSVVLTVDETIGDAADVDGTWPTAPDEAAVHADAAAALGLAVGDRLTVTAEDTELELTVTGTWRPHDARDVHWGGDPHAAEGIDQVTGSHGPVVVTPEALTGLATVPFAVWMVHPGPGIEPADLESWTRGLAGLEQALDDAGVGVRGLTVSDGLGRTLTDAATGLAAVGAATTIPLVVVGLVSFVAFWQIARLLTVLRERETRVLLSRGAGSGRLVAMSGAEAAALTAPGAALGAVLVLLAVLGRDGPRPAVVWLAALAVAVVAAGVLTAVGAHAALTGLLPTSESGRSRSVMTSGALLLVVLAGAFTTWRFARTGSPLLPGTSRPDVLAVAGPALALLALAFVTVAAAGPLARLLADRSGRRRGYSPAMELRQASRRIPLNAVPVVLVVLATAIATMAAAYSGTWSELRRMSADVGNGADVRVLLPGGAAGATPRGVSGYAGLEGATGATGVVQGELRTEDLVGAFTAVGAAHLGVSSAPESVLDRATATAALAPATDPLPGIDLPPGAGELTVEVTASATSDEVGGSGGTRNVAFSAWLYDGDEVVVTRLGDVSLRAEPVFSFDEETQGWVVAPHPDQGRPIASAFTVDVPDGAWRVVALDAELDTALTGTHYEVSFGALTVGGAPVATDQPAWDPGTLEPAADTSTVSAGEGPISLTADLDGPTLGFLGVVPGRDTLRLMPPAQAPVELPVLATPGWDGRLVDAGTRVTLAGAELTVRPVGSVPVVPGNAAEAAVLADLPTLQAALLRTAESVPAVNEVWLAGTDPDLVGAAQGLAGPLAEVVAASDGDTDPVSAPARVVFWVAAVCALLLAVPAVAAVATAQASARRGEVVVLRAVGVGSAQQARSRRRELLGLELGAVAAGVVAGVVVSAVVIVGLVRSTTPQVSRAVPLRLSFDVPGGLALLAVVVATVTAVAWWYARRVLAQARDTTWREEIR